MNKSDITKHLAQVVLYDLKGFDSLYFDLKVKYRQLSAQMQLLGKPIVLVEAFRTAKRQDELYNQKNKVTNAKALESNHQYGIAFDVYFLTYGYSPPVDWWEVLGQQGEKVGLSWGGRWQMKDYPHFEYTGGLDWRELKKELKL